MNAESTISSGRTDGTPVSISIVTPSYNQKTFLESTIRSVLGDGSEPVEYVVIDGGSTDGSAEIIESHADRLAYWCSEPDGGQYEAINKGFQHTTGEVMGWLNSSDLYLPWTIGTVRRIFTEFPEVDWICSLSKCCIEENGTFRGMQEAKGYSRNAFAAGLHGSETTFDFIQQETCFWRRSLWEKAGSRIKDTYKYAGDFHLWSEFFEHACLTGVKVPLAAFRFHDEQRSGVDRYLREVGEVLREMATRPDPPAHHRWTRNLVLTFDRGDGADDSRHTCKYKLYAGEKDGHLFDETAGKSADLEKEKVIHDLATACEERLAIIEKLRGQATFEYQFRKQLQGFLRKWTFGLVK